MGCDQRIGYVWDGRKTVVSAGINVTTYDYTVFLTTTLNYLAFNVDNAVSRRSFHGVPTAF